MAGSFKQFAVFAALASTSVLLLSGCSDVTSPDEPATTASAGSAAFAVGGIPGKPDCLPWQTCTAPPDADPLMPGEDSTTAPVADPAPVASIHVAPNSASLMAGTTAQFEVEIRDSTGNVLAGRTVSWFSSNTTVAGVSSFGLVTALTVGSLTITATSEGVSGSAAVSVTEATTKLTGTPIYPGESIQEKVNNALAGTSFVIMSGVHRRQTIIPKDGQKFIGEPGAILDGEGVTQYAFDLRNNARRDVTVKGLVIRNYTPVNSGGQRGMLELYRSTNWIIEDNEIYGSTVSGIDAGAGIIIRRNKIHSNCYIGIGGRSNGGLIEDNDIYSNGFCPKESASVEGRSGMKLVRSEHLTIRGNRVYRNYADGIWCDIDCRYVAIENNHVWENSGRGIYYEISYDAVIRNNLVERNCLSCGPGIGNAPNWYTGIAVSTSSRVEIYGNTVRDNANGIQVRMDNRGSGAYGTYQLTDLYVHDNIIGMKTGTTGLVQSVGDNSYFTSRNNRFERNAYGLSSLTASHFLWMNGGRTWSQWQDYGQDLTGSAGSI